MARCSCEERPVVTPGRSRKPRCAVCYSRAKARWQQRAHIKHRYGITLEQYDEILKRQNGVCAICGGLGSTRSKHLDSPRRFDVDHDHCTGQVRGLLCNECNRMVLVVVEKYSALIEPARAYLLRHRN